MKRIFFLIWLAAFCLPAINFSAPTLLAEGGKTMNLTSVAFTHEGMIPSKYTCDGANVSPPLAWDQIPEDTKSLALICDDPDAPAGTWVHWVHYDIAPDVTSLPEQVAPEKHPAPGGTHGINDFRKIGYGGPCPPGGTHRYYFRLYALDSTLNLTAGISKKQLLKAMEGHILDQTVLMGKYKR